MPMISLSTKIVAPANVCFDLSRNIDLHMDSAAQTDEQAIGGVVSGLIGPGEEVTWRAKHFGIWFSLTSEITAFDPPRHFRDSMKRGPFKRFDHDHNFEFSDGVTEMKDRFDFNSPFGLIGQIVDAFILEPYLRAFLIKRNNAIKLAAEAGGEKFLNRL